MKSKHKKAIASITITLVFVTSILAGMYHYHWKDTNSNPFLQWRSQYYGDVSINDTYYIIVPVPLNWARERMFYIENYFSIGSDVTYNFTETKHGLGLWIESSEDVIIKSNRETNVKLNGSEDFFAYYSQAVNNITKKPSLPQPEFYTNHLFWVYGNFSSPNNSVDIKIKTNAEKCLYDSGEIEGTITNGWQQINGTYSLDCWTG